MHIYVHAHTYIYKWRWAEILYDYIISVDHDLQVWYPSTAIQMKEIRLQQGGLYWKINLILVTFHESILDSLWTFINPFESEKDCKEGKKLRYMHIYLFKSLQSTTLIPFPFQLWLLHDVDWTSVAHSNFI